MLCPCAHKLWCISHRTDRQRRRQGKWLQVFCTTLNIYIRAVVSMRSCILNITHYDFFEILHCTWTGICDYIACHETNRRFLIGAHLSLRTGCTHKTQEKLLPKKAISPSFINRTLAFFYLILFFLAMHCFPEQLVPPLLWRSRSFRAMEERAQLCVRNTIKSNTHYKTTPTLKPIVLRVPGITETQAWDEKWGIVREQPSASKAELTFRAHSQSLMASLYFPSLM